MRLCRVTLTFALIVVSICLSAFPVLASSQVLFGGNADALNKTNNTTEYNVCSGAYTWDASLFNRSQLVSTSGVIENLYIQLSAAPGVGDDTYTFTLMYDGAPSSLTCAVVGTNTTASDIVDSINVVAGKTISLRVVSSGSPANAPKAQWSLMFVGTTAKESLILGLAETETWTTIYAPIANGFPYGSETELNTREVCPTGGTIKNLYVAIATDPAPGSYSFTLRIANAGNSYVLTNTALTCTITAGHTSANDTAHSITVAPGDILTLKVTPSSSPVGYPNLAQTGFTFVSTVDGESLILGGCNGNLNTSSAVFHALEMPVLNYAWSTEANTWSQLGQTCTLKNLYILLNGAPGTAGSGKAYDFTVRDYAGHSTAITCQVLDTATTGHDTAHSAILNTTTIRQIALMSVPTNTPTARAAYWGLVCYIAPPSIGRSFGVIIGF